VTTFRSLLAWLKDTCWFRPGAEGSTEWQAGLLLRLHTVEYELFSRAIKGFDDVTLDETESSAVVEIVDIYRSLQQRFQQDLDTDAPASNNPIMRSELRSRCVLCAWVAHCLLHAAACAAHPILERFGVGVCWEDLGHLVLSDRQAVDACLNVAGYLHSRSKPGWGIFSLRESRSNGSTSNAAATFALARQRARLN